MIARNSVWKRQGLKRFQHVLSTPAAAAAARPSLLSWGDFAIACSAKQALLLLLLVPFSLSMKTQYHKNAIENKEQSIGRFTRLQTGQCGISETDAAALDALSFFPQKNQLKKQMPRSSSSSSSLSSKRALLSAAFAAFVFFSMLSASSASRPLGEVEVSRSLRIEKRDKDFHDAAKKNF